MKTPQLIVGTIVVAVAVGACNRPDTDEAARRAASEVRQAAARAGDQLADGWLTTKIQAQYFADEDVKGRFINVSADEGVVTLRGRVDSLEAREQAMQIAENTDGVRKVQDLLIVGPDRGAGPGQADASWITTQIQARYFADSVLDGRDIEVTANNGVVTLSGRVGSEREKEEAVAIARDIDGVTRVDDRLVVQDAGAVATTGAAAAADAASRVDDRRVTTSIQAKYFLDNALKNRRIEVDTRQGVVTLRGEIASDDERAQALLLARTTEEVDRVEDILTVNVALAAPAATTGSTTPPATPPVQLQDATLAKTVQSRLSADRRAQAGSIEVTAKDGVVLLSGTAPNAAAKQRALTIARETPGVVQVVDRITVRRVR